MLERLDGIVNNFVKKYNVDKLPDGFMISGNVN